MAVAGPLLYREVASACQSFDKFSWRDLAVRSLPGCGASEAAGGGKDGRISALAGGFHYRGSALVSHTCRNRFILW